MSPIIGYDQFGRPVYQQPPIMPQPGAYPSPMPNSQLDGLNNRLKELETKIYAPGQINPVQANPNNGPGQPVPVHSQTTPQAVSFQPVAGEEEAWAFKIDQWRLMAGERFYFINEKDNEFYIRWWDANNAENVRKVYREIDKPAAERDERQVEDPVIAYMRDMTDKLARLETQVGQMVSLIESKPADASQQKKAAKTKEADA